MRRTSLVVAVLCALLSACGRQASAPPPSPSASAHPAVPGKVALYVDGLPRRVKADGRSFTVRIVLVNDLGHPFPIPGRCNGWLASGLESPTVEFRPLYTLVGCPQDSIPTGVTTLVRTIPTMYASCTQSRTPTRHGDVLCTGPRLNQMPKLPPGEYRLKMDTSSIPELTVRSPVDVTLVG